MTTHPFKGAGVALVTPFNEDKSIDFGTLENIIEDQIRSGMDYLVALGTTAETPTLSTDEQKDVVKCVVSKNNGRLPVVVGMGGNDPVKIIKTMQGFDFTGVDGILSVTPYYNKPTQEGLFRFYQEIIKASPLPIILYNVPPRTGIHIEHTTTLRVANSSNKVVGIKDASGDLTHCAYMSHNAPEWFKVISGDDVLTLPVIAVGGTGVISVIANALPGKLSQLAHLANEHRIAEAQQIHYQLLDLFKLLFREGNPGGVKALMEIMGKAKNVVRLPLWPVSNETYSMIEEAYRKLED
ncbi:MAG: 4-hydroxy-tetrahydrodipicolinate synthase [Bacteroidetes bacterium GWF2_42_66]|nr:MAG: 4-hydroxy-tetrahydrodipicolinate synthase [Bacteroidetes bacterium GWA2_42_15]OFY02525.1 MAG: 4-hydroxy-tetrahydrodipicolinate synthase [Bacteroidetes bacterium GWE2_42_39]OFY41377.1 MAG: 4-hydroxy-tetrahydrodipicolinate synthase [Bacteroidetes bacterium GWF2_42_66]HBL75422.1 4-hydroxy-tetrahydrodipicolinate synthase [Prolixibacteraceae bacterium]HCR91312.1 4-hydroxy-tetrahydrodipicolinate synthase [Prolixibacteraceae bacterium]